MWWERKIYEARVPRLSPLQQGWPGGRGELAKQDPPVSKQQPPTRSAWM